MSSLLVTYGCGVAGSVGVELAGMVDGCRTHRGCLPKVYTRPYFLCLRLLLALIAGILPVASGVTNNMVAIQLGGSAQAILLALQHRRTPPGGRESNSGPSGSRKSADKRARQPDEDSDDATPTGYG